QSHASSYNPDLHALPTRRSSDLGLLEPTIKEDYQGRAEVRDTFRIPKVGTVAGCYVQDGIIKRDSEVRLLRDNVVMFKGKVGSLDRKSTRLNSITRSSRMPSSA